MQKMARKCVKKKTTHYRFNHTIGLISSLIITKFIPLKVKQKPLTVLWFCNFMGMGKDQSTNKIKNPNRQQLEFS